MADSFTPRPTIGAPRPVLSAKTWSGHAPSFHANTTSSSTFIPYRGSIKLNFPDIDVWEMGETCALDVADRGGITLEEVGEIMNLTRERVRQVETAGLSKLEGVQEVDRLKDYVS